MGTDDNSVNVGDISGGSYMAIGRNAHVAHAQNAPADDRRADVLRSLEEVNRQIEVYAAQLPDAERLRDLTALLLQQLEEDRPNQTAVNSFLGSLQTGVVSVAAISEAVARLTQMVGALF